MTKNIGVIDNKPINSLVVDPKSNNKTVLDTRPNNSPLASNFETEQFYSITINRGQSMGLLLALTYPATFTVVSSKSP